MNAIAKHVELIMRCPYDGSPNKAGTIGRNQKTWLSDKQKLGLVYRYRDGETVETLADEYGCHISTAFRIIQRQDRKDGIKTPSKKFK